METPEEDEVIRWQPSGIPELLPPLLLRLPRLLSTKLAVDMEELERAFRPSAGSCLMTLAAHSASSPGSPPELHEIVPGDDGKAPYACASEGIRRWSGGDSSRSAAVNGANNASPRLGPLAEAGADRAEDARSQGPRTGPRAESGTCGNESLVAEAKLVTVPGDARLCGSSGCRLCVASNSMRADGRCAG